MMKHHRCRTLPSPPSIVIVDLTGIPPETAVQYPFKHGESMLYLGEINNMPGHVIVINRAGEVLWGYHAEDFRKPIEDEI